MPVLLLSQLLEESGLGICVDQTEDLDKLESIDFNAMRNTDRNAAGQLSDAGGADMIADRLPEMAENKHKGFFSRLKNSLCRVFHRS